MKHDDLPDSSAGDLMLSISILFTAPWQNTKMSDGNIIKSGGKTFISGSLSFSLTRKGVSCKKDRFTGKAYKTDFRYTAN